MTVKDSDDDTFPPFTDEYTSDDSSDEESSEDDPEDYEVKYDSNGVIVPQNDLEKEYLEVVGKVLDQIDDKIAKASAILREAVNLADQHGVVFSSHVSFLRNKYVPNGFKKTKFADLPPEFIGEACGTWLSEDTDLEWGGWQHSAVC